MVALAVAGAIGLSACQADVTVVGGPTGGAAAPTGQATQAPQGNGSGGASDDGAQQNGATHHPVDFPKTKPSPGDPKGTVVANDAGRKVVPDTTLPVFAPDPSTADDDGEIPNTQWPDAQDLFSVKELKHVFPDASSISIRNCLPTKDYSTDSLTAHNATCDIIIKMPGDTYSNSKVTVTVEGVGTQKAMLDDFDSYRKVSRKTSKKLHDEARYFYYQDGSFGTQRYTNHFGEAKVLIGNGKTSMEVELDPSGFYDLAEDNDEFDVDKESKSEKIFRQQIMPLLLQLLVQRM